MSATTQRQKAEHLRNIAHVTAMRAAHTTPDPRAVDAMLDGLRAVLPDILGDARAYRDDDDEVQARALIRAVAKALGASVTE